MSPPLQLCVVGKSKLVHEIRQVKSGDASAGANAYRGHETGAQEFVERGAADAEDVGGFAWGEQQFLHGGSLLGGAGWVVHRDGVLSMAASMPCADRETSLGALSSRTLRAATRARPRLRRCA